MTELGSEDGADGDGRTDPAPAPRTALVRVLLTVIAVAVLAIAVAGGFAWGHHGRSTASRTVAPNAVDIGFARDMSVHHQQAITMAAYARDNSTDPPVVNLAYDIESNQSIEMGEMIGWLDTWDVSRYTAHPMVWMGAEHASLVHDGLMPGMATAAQIATLMSLRGKALDILFLQLMIHHHQGGTAMLTFAVQHASEPYVRTLAGHMLANQGSQTIEMEQLLRQLGGHPLPPPVN